MSEDKDISDILNYFVKAELPEETEFLEEQRKEGIKVCDTILHEKKNDGEDTLKIITSLHNKSCNFESSSMGNVTSEFSDSNNSNFFIKEMKLHHLVKSNSVNEEHETNVTTVIGNKNSKIEAVYNASVIHSDTGQKLIKHTSYLRPANKPNSMLRQPSSRSLPENSMYSINITTKDEKSNKVKKKKNWFKNFKKNKKTEIKFEEIDDLARKQVTNNKEETKTVNPLFGLKGEIPFKSFKIGESSQKKIKKLKSRLGSVIALPSSQMTANIGNDLYEPIKEYSANIGTVENVGARSITATLDSATEEITYTTNMCDNDFTKSSDDSKIEVTSGSVDKEELHLEMLPPKNKSRRMSCPEKVCDCDTKRKELISTILIQKLDKIPEKESWKLLEQFNNKTLHFKSCFYNNSEFVVQSKENEDWRQSQISLYQYCELCESNNDQSSPGLSPNLLHIIGNIEEKDKLQYTDEYLNFFQKENCYEHFEKGLQQSIGVRCTPYNLARLHDVARRIIRNIGDPNKGYNKTMKRILRFVEKFYSIHFEPHIQDYHGSVEEFLKHCQCKNLEDID